MLVTGEGCVNTALSAYFSKMSAVFVYNMARQELTLKHDYFSNALKKELDAFRIIKTTTQNNHEVREIFDVAGQITKMTNTQAVIEFEAQNGKATRKVMALLKREDFKCRDRVGVGTAVKFNAVKTGESNVQECQWICTSAWLPESKLYDLVGKISAIDSDWSGGEISFTAPHLHLERARFSFCDLYNLRIDCLEVGTEVSFDAEPNDMEFIATMIWSGPRPTNEDLKIMTLKKRLDFYLDGCSSFGTDLNNNAGSCSSDDMIFDAEMPESVQSVISGLLKEEQKPKRSLANQVVLEDLIYEFELEAHASKIMTQVEAEFRSCFSGILAKIIK